MQENHSFDNYFGTYLGADGLPAGVCMPVRPGKPERGCVKPHHLGDRPLRDHSHDDYKTALRQLEQKLTEAQAKSDLLIARHRRARAVGKAHDARTAIGDGSKSAAFDRMKRKVAHNEAVSQAKSELGADDVEDRFMAMEKSDRIEQLLAEMKAKHA